MARVRNAFDFGMQPYALHSDKWQDRVGSPQLLKDRLRLLTGGMVYRLDHFDQDTMNADYYALASDDDADDFAIDGSLAGMNAVKAGTSTTADSFSSVRGPAIYDSDRRAGFEVRFRVSNPTETQWEIGFIDGINSDATLPAVTNVDTGAIDTGANDAAAVFAFDTDATLSTVGYFAGEDSENDMGDTGLTIAGFEWNTLRVQTNGDNAYFWVFDEDGMPRHENPFHLSANINGLGLMPWFIGGTTNTTAKTYWIDYWAVWSDI